MKRDELLDYIKTHEVDVIALLARLPANTACSAVEAKVLQECRAIVMKEEMEK